jgi:hypothetical protein
VIQVHQSRNDGFPAVQFDATGGKPSLLGLSRHAQTALRGLEHDAGDRQIVSVTERD